MAYSEDLDFLEVLLSAALKETSAESVELKVSLEALLHRAQELKAHSLAVKSHAKQKNAQRQQNEEYAIFLEHAIATIEQLYYTPATNRSAEDQDVLLSLADVLNTFHIDHQYRDILKDNVICRWIPLKDGIFPYCHQHRKKLIQLYREPLSPLWNERVRLMDEQYPHPYFEKTRDKNKMDARDEIIMDERDKNMMHDRDKNIMDDKDQNSLTVEGRKRLSQLLINPKRIRQGDADREQLLLSHFMGPELLGRIAKRYHIDLHKPLNEKQLRMIFVGASTIATPQDPIYRYRNDLMKEMTDSITYKSLLISRSGKTNRIFMRENKQYRKDLAFLTTQNFFKHKYPTNEKTNIVVNELVHEIQQDLTYAFVPRVDPLLKEIIKKYPALSEKQLGKEKYAQLKGLSHELFEAIQNNELPQNAHDALILSKKTDLSRFIMNEYKIRQPFARAECIGHRLAGDDLFSRDGHVITLPNEDNEQVDFNIQGVIRDRKGLAMALLSPEGIIPAEQDTIPLIVTFAGTHNLASLHRDTDPLGAGASAFDPNHPQFKKMIAAVNQKVGELKAQYPNKKISIEVFGHSLGGADSYHFMLAVLQAMSQNENPDPMMIENTRKALQSVDNDYAEKEQHIHLADALDNVLGNQSRTFTGDFPSATHPTDLKAAGIPINHLTLDNIAFISGNTSNSAGLHHQTSYSLHAAAAYLGFVDKSKHNGENHFKIKTVANLTKGDVIQQTADTRDFAYATPEGAGRECFSHVDVKILEHNWGYQHYFKQILNLKLSLLNAHIDFNFSKLRSWLKQKQIMYSNKNSHHQKQQNRILNDQFGFFKIFPDVHRNVHAIKNAVHDAGNQVDYLIDKHGLVRLSTPLKIEPPSLNERKRLFNIYTKNEKTSQTHMIHVRPLQPKPRPRPHPGSHK